MHDRLVDEEVRYINGTTYYVATYEMTELPDGCEIDLDAIYPILETGRKRWDIKDENALSGFHRNVDQESRRITYVYSLLVPLKKVIQLRRKERLEAWEKGSEVTLEEKRLFSSLGQGKRSRIEELPIFCGDSKSIAPSPIDMPGFPEEYQEDYV